MRVRALLSMSTPAVCATLVAVAAPASAWPSPTESQQERFVAVARGSGFPGDDDTVIAAGMIACQNLHARQLRQAVIVDLVSQYGATPQAASSAVSAARGILCPGT